MNIYQGAEKMVNLNILLEQQGKKREGEETGNPGVEDLRGKGKRRGDKFVR